MENNTETQNSIQFMIYRNGELDKAFYYKQQAERLLRGVGSIAYKALDITFDRLDEMVEAFNS